MTSWLQVAGEATQIRMALVAACPHPQQGHMALILDFHVAFGDNADPGYGKTTDLDTQTWFLPASGSGYHHGPQVMRPQETSVSAWSLDTNLVPEIGPTWS